MKLRILPLNPEVDNSALKKWNKAMIITEGTLSELGYASVPQFPTVNAFTSHSNYGKVQCSVIDDIASTADEVNNKRLKTRQDNGHGRKIKSTRNYD
jgi:hypothetical protein